MTTPVLEELRKRATAAELVLIDYVVAAVSSELQADKIRAEVRAEIISELRQMAESSAASRFESDRPEAQLLRGLQKFLKANPAP